MECSYFTVSKARFKRLNTAIIEEIKRQFGSDPNLRIDDWSKEAIVEVDTGGIETGRIFYPVPEEGRYQAIVLDFMTPAEKKRTRKPNANQSDVKFRNNDQIPERIKPPS